MSVLPDQAGLVNGTYVDGYGDPSSFIFNLPLSCSRVKQGSETISLHSLLKGSKLRLTKIPFD